MADCNILDVFLGGIKDSAYLQFESFQKADEWGKVQYGKYGEEYKKIVDRRKNYTNNQKQKIPIHKYNIQHK